MSFAAQLQAFADRTKLKTDLVVQKITLDIAKSVIEKSPVGNPELWKGPAPAGYVGGRFRANWMFGDGAIDATTTDDIDKSGNTTMTRLATAINSTKAGGVTYISNSLPYGPRLEYEGHSTQAPAGMVRLTVAEFQRYVDRAARSA